MAQPDQQGAFTQVNSGLSPPFLHLHLHPSAPSQWFAASTERKEERRHNSHPFHKRPRLNHEIIQCLCGPRSVVGRQALRSRERDAPQPVCGNHIGRNPWLIQANTLCFSGLRYHPFPPSLFDYPFLGFHFYSLGDQGGGKGVKK